MPLGQAGISAVDIRDIAEAAAIALTSDGHLGKTYNLNGPNVLSGPTMASIWSGLLGKEIRYSGDDMDAFEEQMRTRAPSWSAFDIRMMFEGYLERGFAAEAGDIQTLTGLLGHPPRRYEDFAAETAALWKALAASNEVKPRRNIKEEKRNVNCSTDDPTGQPQTQSHAGAARRPPSHRSGRRYLHDHGDGRRDRWTLLRN
jgi:hypothetical protein